MNVWPEIIADESIPVNHFRFQHLDGRMDLFMLIDNEVVPIHLTKLDDPPSWACPICSFVNEQDDKSCTCCGLSLT